VPSANRTSITVNGVRGGSPASSNGPETCGLADDLASTGELRADLTLDEVADVIWTTNSSEYYAQLVFDRGWSSPRFEEWLLDAWSRLLLAPTAPLR
jgi:hypothetical protein